MDLIGRMDKIVVFLNNTPTPLGAGNKDNYAAAVTTRGYWKQEAGNRDGGFGDIKSNVSGALIVRKQTALTAILHTKLKVQFDSRTFTVQSWEDIHEDHFYYKFYLTEQRA